MNRLFKHLHRLLISYEGEELDEAVDKLQEEEEKKEEKLKRKLKPGTLERDL